MYILNSFKQTFSIKKLFILFCINAVNDLISVCEYIKINTDEISNVIIYNLFDRFLCTNLSIFKFSQYISFYGFIAFCLIDKLFKDHQKFGLFYITRLGRKRYAFLSDLSVFISLITVCSVSVFQTLCTHAIFMNIKIKYYYFAFALVLTIILFSVQMSVFIYLLTKSYKFSFIVSAFSICGFALCNSIERQDMYLLINFPKYYMTAFILAVLLSFANGVLLYESDFLTTKIKE